MTSENGDQGLEQYVEEYISPEEDVNAVSTGDSRTFAVTDRRVINIRETKTNKDRSLENISTTVFTNVNRGDISIEGSTTNTDTPQVITGVLFGLAGVIGIIFGLNSTGSGTIIGLVVGAVLIGLAGWLLSNATERISGGIRIKLHHNAADNDSPDRYILPEDQDSTARAIVRNLGRKHGPSTRTASSEVTDE